MKSELQQLLINDFEQLAGQSYLQDKKKIDSLGENYGFWVFYFFPCSPLILWGLFQTIGYLLKDWLNLDINLKIILITVFCVLLIIVVGVIGIKRTTKNNKKKESNFNRKYANLVSFKCEVENHNKIIKDIDILDQLQSLGNPTIPWEKREKVISVLSTNKENIVRAVKTERILRENPLRP